VGVRSFDSGGAGGWLDNQLTGAVGAIDNEAQAVVVVNFAKTAQNSAAKI
jgi:hypothetical protein